MKRFLSVLLAIAMIITLVPLSAFAGIEAQTKLPEQDVYRYAAIGDSITSGYGLTGGLYNALQNSHWGSANSYPAVLADALAVALDAVSNRPVYTTGSEEVTTDEGTETKTVYYQQLPGEEPRSVVLNDSNLWVVEGTDTLMNDFGGTEVKFDFANVGCPGYTMKSFFDDLGSEAPADNPGWTNMVRDEVKNADLITVQLGGNDMIQPFAVASYYELTTNKLLWAVLQQASNVVFGGSIGGPVDLSDVTIADVLQFMNFIRRDNLSKIITDGLMAAMDQYYEEIIDEILVLNPDAQIVLLGAANPYGNSIEYQGKRYTVARVFEIITEEIWKASVANAAKNLNDAIEKATKEEESVSKGPLLMAAPKADPLEELKQEVIKEIEEKTGEKIDTEVKANESPVLKAAPAKQPLDDAEAATKDLADFFDLITATINSNIQEASKVLSDAAPQILDRLDYLIMHSLLGKVVDGAIDKFNLEAENVANERKLPFVYIYDKGENEADYDPHPNAINHEAIAKAIEDVVIKDIHVNSNNDALVDEWLGAMDAQKIVYGQKLSFFIPKGVQFAVVNNKRVYEAFDRNLGSRWISLDMTIDGGIDDDIFVYLHGWDSQTSKAFYNGQEHGDSYTAIGDSITAGFNIADGELLPPLAQEGYPTSYPALINSLTGKNTYNWGTLAFESPTVLHLLSQIAGDDADIIVREFRVQPYSTDSLTKVKEAERLKLNILDSDTITASIGSNDLMMNLVGKINLLIGLENTRRTTDVPILFDLIKSLEQGDLSAIRGILNQIGTIDITDIAVEEIVNIFTEEKMRHELRADLEILKHNMIQNAFELDKLLADDVDVALIGYYNPVPVETTLKLGNSVYCPLGQIAQSAMDDANAFLKELAEAYGWEYVDISDIDVALKHGQIDPHPTDLGQKQIAEKVMRALGLEAKIRPDDDYEQTRFIPVSQNPTITVDDGAETVLYAYGSSLDITVKDGYELVDVTLNGESKGKVTTLTGLHTGDEVVIKTAVQTKKYYTEKQVQDVTEQLKLKVTTKYVTKSGKKVIQASAAVTDGKVALLELLDSGYTVKYAFYRGTTKKASSFKKMYTTTNSKYTNTSGTKGKTYYYKVVVKIYDPNGKLVDQTELSQSKYGSRKFK